MSYARKGPHSAVYVTATDRGDETHVGREMAALVCHACTLSGGQDHVARSRRAMFAHLSEHRSAGQPVPAGVFDALLDESAEYGDHPADSWESVNLPDLFGYDDEPPASLA